MKPLFWDTQFFIQVLLNARHQAQLSQSEVALRIGRPQSFVSKYESGERRLIIEDFIVISRALDLDPVDAVRKFVATMEIVGSSNNHQE